MAITREDLMIGGVRRFLNGTARVFPRQAGRLGYRLLSRPRRASLDAVSFEFIEQAEQKNIVFNGIPIQTYYWPGEGPGVLLLHGWESCTGRWYEFYEFLRDAGFAIYAIDAPAHGRSGGDNFTVIEYAHILREYLESLENPPVHWVGHSGGGMAILYYLSQLKDITVKPKRVVAMSVPAELTDFLNKFQNVLGLRNKVVEGIEKEFIRRMQMTFKDISPARYARDIGVPGLIIHDVEDDLAPVDGAEAIYKNWNNSSLILTEGLGHSLVGMEVVELITEYLRLEDEELMGEG
jgi:pimeloyl-ACP methyl ester carboxylesterase